MQRTCEGQSVAVRDRSFMAECGLKTDKRGDHD